MFTTDSFRLPAEWEPQSGVQLTWPHAQTDWVPMLDEITGTYREMAREIARREPLLVVTPHEDAPLTAMDAETRERTTTVVCPTNDTWARDHGFITLTNGRGEARLADFKFNGWGRKFEAEQDNAINRHIYDAGRLEGTYVDCLDFVLEGGSIESDGRGTIFTTTDCLMAKNRNQPMTQDEIDRRLKETLGADRVVWIDHGRLTGDDTDGHIDTLVRVAPDDTLLYIGSDDKQDEQYTELKLMEEQLHTLRTQDGRPYRLMKLPTPRPLRDETGERMPATYANFLIINGAVLCPTYGQADLDSEALETIGRAFPGREVVAIDCRPIIRQHGSLHCCTMQFPAGVLKP